MKFYKTWYYRRLQDAGTYLEEFAEDTAQSEVKTVKDFLDGIENQRLYQALIMMDRLTLQIAVMKIQGYSTHEIALHLGITEKAVYRRMDRLKEKLKKFLSRGENQGFSRTMGCKAQKPSPRFPLCGENGIAL